MSSCRNLNDIEVSKSTKTKAACSAECENNPRCTSFVFKNSGTNNCILTRPGCVIENEYKASHNNLVVSKAFHAAPNRAPNVCTHKGEFSDIYQATESCKAITDKSLCE